MLECDSPFLVRLYGTAQDDATLYMLMEAVMGGELFSYLQVSHTSPHGPVRQTGFWPNSIYSIIAFIQSSNHRIQSSVSIYSPRAGVACLAGTPAGTTGCTQARSSLPLGKPA
jgi:hypothetical protein